MAGAAEAPAISSGLLGEAIAAELPTDHLGGSGGSPSEGPLELGLVEVTDSKTKQAIPFAACTSGLCRAVPCLVGG